MQKRDNLMTKIATLFSILLISPFLINSYALPIDDSVVLDNSEKLINFNSDIIDVDSDFFSENDFKRYLIFGSNLFENNNIQVNSLYSIQSDYGFFSVSLLSSQSASNLISQGYHVIEDSQLDFHSFEKTISDVSRIGNITGSEIARTQYNATGNDIVIAIVDTGVDFSNPDIQHSLARDEMNYPMMLDPDGQGIVLTNATFFANIDKYETVKNYSKTIPDNITSSVYTTRDGIFLESVTRW